MDFYAEDLAHVHHVGFSSVALGAAPFLLDVLAEICPTPPARLVDLGCGGGVFLREAKAAGHEVFGVEISPAFVALARHTSPDIPIQQSSVYDADLPSCHMVTAIGEVLCYIPPDSADAPPIPSLFQRVYDALLPGGSFLFDVIAAHPDHSLSGQHWVSEEDWVVLVDADEDKRAHLLKRKITTFRQHGDLYRRTDEFHVQYLFDPGFLEAQLNMTGFHVRHARSYGTFALAPRRVMFHAHKPAG